MRISAYLETGLEKVRPDERLLIKSYDCVSDHEITEHSTLLMEAGTFDGEFECPLLMAVVDGCNEYEGACLASEITASVLNQFSMSDFLECDMVSQEQKAAEEEPASANGGGVIGVGGSLGASGKVSASLKEINSSGLSLSDNVIVFKDKQEQENLNDKKTPEELVANRKEIIREYLTNLNETLILDGEQPWAKKGMASYLTGGIFLENETYLYHIGGLKFLRKKGLSQYWESVTTEQVDFSKNNIEDRVIGCLGSDKDRSEHIMVEQIGDLINKDKPAVLLSEGVYRFIEPAKLREFFERKEPALTICRSMAEYARANGSIDDISIVLLNFQG